jgi:hypothetical protein
LEQLEKNKIQSTVESQPIVEIEVPVEIEENKVV